MNKKFILIDRSLYLIIRRSTENIESWENYKKDLDSYDFDFGKMDVYEVVNSKFYKLNKFKDSNQYTKEKDFICDKILLKELGYLNALLHSQKKYSDRIKIKKGENSYGKN
ncbi:MAG: hypothetical protein PHF21_03930 [Bacilli bacterium]|nr:hypothetical protein [Bacilli bacterium]